MRAEGGERRSKRRHGPRLYGVLIRLREVLPLDPRALKAHSSRSVKDFVTI